MFKTIRTTFTNKIHPQHQKEVAVLDAILSEVKVEEGFEPRLTVKDTCSYLHNCNPLFIMNQRVNDTLACIDQLNIKDYFDAIALQLRSHYKNMAVFDTTTGAYHTLVADNKNELRKIGRFTNQINCCNPKTISYKYIEWIEILNRSDMKEINVCLFRFPCMVTHVVRDYMCLLSYAFEKLELIKPANSPWYVDEFICIGYKPCRLKPILNMLVTKTPSLVAHKETIKYSNEVHINDIFRKVRYSHLFPPARFDQERTLLNVFQVQWYDFKMQCMMQIAKCTKSIVKGIYERNDINFIMLIDFYMYVPEEKIEKDSIVESN